MAKQQLEYKLQKQICQYLQLQYPKLLFLSDSIASCKLTMPQATRNKAVQKQGFKCPDLLILEPRGNFAGLLIELKVKSPFKANGELYSDEHIIAQNKSLEDLRNKGFYTCFSWSFDMTKKIIDGYLNIPQKPVLPE